MPNDAATLVARPPLLPVRAGCLPWRTRGASDVSHASTATTACPSSARSPPSMATAGWETRPPPRRPPTTTRTLERAGPVLVRVSEVLLQGASSMNVRSGGRGAGVSEGCSERELEREAAERARRQRTACAARARMRACERSPRPQLRASGLAGPPAPGVASQAPPTQTHLGSDAVEAQQVREPYSDHECGMLSATRRRRYFMRAGFKVFHFSPAFGVTWCGGTAMWQCCA